MSLLALLTLAAAAAPGNATADQVATARKFAACIARSAPGEARAFLMVDSQNPAFGAGLAAAVNGSGQKCQKKAGDLSVGTAQFGGMIAEALLHARFQPTISLDDLKLDTQPQLPSFSSPGDILGLCVATKAPAAVAQLLGSEPGSAAETRQLEAIRPAVNSCLKAGTTIRGNPAAVRSMVSLAAWRVVFAEKAR